MLPPPAPPSGARHCEKRSDEAIHVAAAASEMDCFAALAMTVGAAPVPVPGERSGRPCDAYRQNRSLAIRAPSVSAANFAQTMSGSTAAWPTQVP